MEPRSPSVHLRQALGGRGPPPRRAANPGGHRTPRFFLRGDAGAARHQPEDRGPKKVTAFIGPSGCGKSTLLRCLNRMNDLIDGTRVARGTIKIHGVDIYQPDVDVIELRKRVGMVFQKSNPFPKSIYENITYGLRLQGVNGRIEARRDRRKIAARRGALGRSQGPADASGLGLVRRTTTAALHRAGDRGGAGVIILMDEPCSALDPVATAKVEELIQELKARSRSSSSPTTCSRRRVARTRRRFSISGLIEYADTRDIFTNPANPRPRPTSRAASAKTLSP
jgi:phosphate transport system ATP-binding protein